jgi:hypothetical protein
MHQRATKQNSQQHSRSKKKVILPKVMFYEQYDKLSTLNDSYNEEMRLQNQSEPRYSQ